MASTYLSMTGTGDAKKWTFSGWFKKALNGSEQRLITSSDNSTYDDNIRFNSDDTITIRYRNAVVLKTNRKFRDNNAYYHIVVKVDTDQSTANDRVVLYINGVDERTVGGYGTDSMPGQGLTGYLNYNVTYIGFTNPSANSNHFNGIMSHVHFTDGYAYDASAFGSTDSTTGEWKINTSPSVTYGANGFFILKDGNSVTDQSGEGNDFTVGGGTLTKTEDNPSNVFATLNPLHIQGTTSRSITYGNTRFYTTTTAWGSALSTLGFSSGKFYVEAKILALNSSTGYGAIAIQDINAFGSSGNTNANLAENSAGAGVTPDYRSGQSAIRSGGSTVSSNVGDFSNNDIIGMAIDMDNKALYMHKNGTYYQIGGVTGVPTSGASKTGAITIPASVETCAIGLGSYTSNADSCYNFGNGYFATTAVSSAGTNASGNGIFEYDVPTGYTALSTKGVNL
jgi:hypothetical protein